jgi:multidrug efflux system outer membrane protein
VKTRVGLYLIAGVGLAILFAVGCAVGPDYRRPAMVTPLEFRAPDSATNASTGQVEISFGDVGWWETFNDPRLQALIHEALTNSYDVQIAAARVLQAEASLRVTRSQFMPTINAGGDLVTSRTSERGPVALPPGANPERGYGDVFVSMPGYELDLWGRIRRATEASRALLLATEEAQRTVRQTIVAEVATAYLQLLELDLELEISHRTYVGRTNSLDLTMSREQGGVAQMQDVYQAQILVWTADAAISDTLRRIEQKENEISILLGRNPGKIERSSSLAAQTLRAEVPSGLTSALLERRPDIRAAEHQLVAANANIGEAKAAFYPQVTLTGFYGYQTVALSDLFTSAARAWQFGPAVTFPLFTGGRLRGNLKLNEARFQESVAIYRQTVQQAFREVSDSLIAYQRTREFYQKEQARTEANRAATDLAHFRYEGGVTSYLEVLYNEQELFNAELTLAQARRDELLSVVQLYRALGGGWTEPKYAMTQPTTK